MRKTCIALLALSLFTVACNKKSNPSPGNGNNNGTTGNDTASAFAVTGLGNTTLTNTAPVATMALNINYRSGVSGPVTLGVTGVPSGLTATFSTTTGTPDFATILRVTAGGVAPGTYHLSLIATGAFYTKTLPFDVTMEGSADASAGNWTVGSTNYTATKGAGVYKSGVFSISAYITTGASTVTNFISISLFAKPPVGTTQYAITNTGSANTCEVAAGTGTSKSYMATPGSTAAQITVVRRNDNSMTITIPTVTAIDASTSEPTAIGGTITLNGIDVTGL